MCVCVCVRAQKHFGLCLLFHFYWGHYTVYTSGAEGFSSLSLRCSCFWADQRHGPGGSVLLSVELPPVCSFLMCALNFQTGKEIWLWRWSRVRSVKCTLLPVMGVCQSLSQDCGCCRSHITSKRTSIKPYPYLVGKQCLFFSFFWWGWAVGSFSSGQIASGSGRESGKSNLEHNQRTCF